MELWQFVTAAAGDLTRHILSIVDDLIPPVPAEIDEACGTVNAFLAQQSWIAEVFPLPALAIAAATVAAVIIAATAIRVARIAVSVKTGGGGA